MTARLRRMCGSGSNFICSDQSQGRFDEPELEVLPHWTGIKPDSDYLGITRSTT